MHDWVVGIGLPPQDYGTHSLRRTKALIINREKEIRRAFRIFLSHAKIYTMVLCLGVAVEDALELSERTEFRAFPDTSPLVESGHSFMKAMITATANRRMCRIGSGIVVPTRTIKNLAT